MGVLVSVSKYLENVARAVVGKKPSRDRIIDVMQNYYPSGVPQQWTGDRFSQIANFRGWPYVSINPICQEIANLVPKVCRIIEEEVVHGEYTKALGVCKSFDERRVVTSRYKKKYLGRKQITKALAHVQDGDILEPVSGRHPLVKLLQHPNGLDTAFTFQYKIPMYLRLTGIAYIYAPGSVGSDQPAELWVLPSHWVRPVAGPNNLIDEYEIRPTAGMVAMDGWGVGWFPGVGGIKRVPAREIIQIAYPHPSSLTDGFSPISAVGQWIDVSQHIDNSRVQTFANGMFPGVVIEMDADMDPDQNQIERAQEQIAAKYAEVKNSRKPVVLGPGLKLVPSPYASALEMDYANSGTQVADWIMAANRVGKSIVGINEQTAYASLVATQAGFYYSLKPDLTLIGQKLTEGLAKRYGDDLCIYFADPTPEDPAEKRAKWAWLVQSGLATPNEAREAYDMDPYEHGGDDPLLSPGLQAIPWATGHDPMEDALNTAGQQQQQPGGENEPDFSVLDEILDDAAGSDGAEEMPAGESVSNLPTPIGKRLNGHARNGVSHVE